MFAGKTSTLLRRIKTESSNGRKDYSLGKKIHWQMIIVGCVSNEYLNVKLLILCAKAGDHNLAHILFDKLQMKSLVSWNSMIAGYAQKGLEEVGLSMFHEMRNNGLIPDHHSFASVFRQAHALWIKCQISGNLVVNSALMDK
ncbi:unnamed protein product [Coffea canephora]|uniref:DH200=94 genomic scaffold, scaffold_675 n=1 Tax=Coffea canephora TaxID=49390 RepID=A0A068VGE8_COFCA|nr:unnamed protein product [Coffea canephora]CDP19781.1 unnamed protein product [Coffea canephora]